MLSTSEARIQEGRPGRSPAQTRCRARTRGEGVKLPKGYSGHSYLSGALSLVQLNSPERRPGEGAGPGGPPPGQRALPGAGRRAPGPMEESLSPPGSQGLGLKRAECTRPGSGPPPEQPTHCASAPTSSQEPPIPQGPSSAWPGGTIFLIQPIISPIPTAWPWVRLHSFSFRPAVSFPTPDSPSLVTHRPDHVTTLLKAFRTSLLPTEKSPNFSAKTPTHSYRHPPPYGPGARPSRKLPWTCPVSLPYTLLPPFGLVQIHHGHPRQSPAALSRLRRCPAGTFQTVPAHGSSHRPHGAAEHLKCGWSDVQWATSEKYGVDLKDSP